MELLSRGYAKTQSAGFEPVAIKLCRHYMAALARFAKGMIRNQGKIYDRLRKAEAEMKLSASRNVHRGQGMNCMSPIESTHALLSKSNPLSQVPVPVALAAGVSHGSLATALARSP